MFKNSKRIGGTNKEESVIFLASLYTDIENYSLRDDLSPFEKEFSRLLQQKNFLPHGGTLGFGLKYKYNYSEADSFIHGAEIRGLRSLLITTDKILFALSCSYNIEAELKVVYKMKDYPGVSILASTLSPFPNQPYPYPPTWENTRGFPGLCENIAGSFTELSHGKYTSSKKIVKIEWVSPILHTNIRPEFLGRVSGKPVVSYIDGSYVLTMRVPEWSQLRATAAAIAEEAAAITKPVEAAKSRKSAEAERAKKLRAAEKRERSGGNAEDSGAIKTVSAGAP